MPSSDEVRAYNRLYYQRNKEHLLKKQAEKNRRFAESRRKWLVEYKNLECVRCGESHPATLTFHHRDSSDKTFEIGNALTLGVSLKRLIAEIEKCDVICANCHAKEHLSHMFE
jgi:hypothetical protein